MELVTSPIRVAMFSSKKNDVDYFDAVNSEGEFEMTYFKEKLNHKTALTAFGYDAVCVFINDEVNEKVIDVLVNLNFA